MSDINAILDRHGIKRCGDSSCIFGPRGGMMTNGGCRCGHDDPGAPSRPTRLSRQLAHAVTEQAAEIARLTAEQAAARAVTAGVCRYLDCAASDLLAVVTSLYETRARAISDATAAHGTVGGLLATAPVGSIVEFVDCAFWYQARVNVDDSVEWYETRRRHATDARWMPWRRGIPPVRPSARLVPAAEADADPNQRGPLLAATAPVCPGPDCPMCNGEACDKCNPGPGRPRCDHDGQERHEPPTATPRCSCTHEAGDSHREDAP